MSTATRPRPVQLIERVAQSASTKIDETNAVIRGVKLLGFVSGNGREYAPTCLRSAAESGLYEMRPVHIDHGSRPGSPRGVASRFGWIQNSRFVDGVGLVGDLHYLRSHPQAAAIVEAAKRNPALVGLSHDAEGQTVQRVGKTVVEKLTRVRSVDIVSDPATTRSLFESTGQLADPPTMSASEFLESIRAEEYDQRHRAVGDRASADIPKAKPAAIPLPPEPVEQSIDLETVAKMTRAEDVLAAIDITPPAKTPADIDRATAYLAASSVPEAEALAAIGILAAGMSGRQDLPFAISSFRAIRSGRTSSAEAAIAAAESRRADEVRNRQLLDFVHGRDKPSIEAGLPQTADAFLEAIR